MCDSEDFYKDAVIFVTGATGFVGKTLLEKLLWSFPEIARIYILIREKSGFTVAQRYQAFVQHKIFERLRMNFPERLEKLQYLSGNIECDDFGLSAADRHELCENVQIIFHSAATVRFNERLKVASQVNAIGTLHLLEMCKKMPQLKSFVYVSTAYCNPGRKYVDELIYPTLPPVNWKMFVDCTNKIPDAYFNSLANYIKGPHPNTYTFTKSIAEQIVNEYKHYIPIVIVRPSIVTAAHREPYPGWIDNIQGITGIMMEIGKGTISSILGDKDIICDIIPVDFVVNSLILMAKKATLGRVCISNATSGVTNPITWARLGCLTLKWSRVYPTKRIMMFPNFKYQKSFLLHEIAVILLHYAPALLMDLLTVLRLKRKFVLPIAKKFRQACLAGRTFSLNEWIFKNHSRHYFKDLLPTKAAPEILWNLESLDYDTYIRAFVIGIQKYLHREHFQENSSKWKITRLYWTWSFLHLFIPLLTVYMVFALK
ncbi:putative fatty acyl-CoA reductase CG5065 [Eurosta solidaginis]|uniref:putative fatty acyl-CoA reductase CG5065 n=1 Tax=Eurosta solidaginis TaxID=178769 RepID=UPI003530EAAE